MEVSFAKPDTILCCSSKALLVSLNLVSQDSPFDFNVANSASQFFRFVCSSSILRSGTQAYKDRTVDVMRR
jgi:hypothetical protein